MPTPLRQREPWRGHQHSQHETAHDLSDGHRLLPRLVPVDGDSGGTETREARDPRVCRSTLLETYGRRCGLTRCLGSCPILVTSGEASYTPYISPGETR